MIPKITRKVISKEKAKFNFSKLGTKNAAAIPKPVQ